MRLIIIIILTFAGGLAALTGCGGDGGAEANAPGRSSIAASFYPLAFAAEEVGGDHVSVTNLTPAGAEPHDLEVSPDDVATLRDADLVLLLGDGFQPQLEDASGDGDNVLLLLDTPGLDLRPGDPHVWLDPIRFATVVRRIAEALGEPGAADSLVAKLQQLDREYRDGLGNCERRQLVTSHDAFGYLADRYGLEQVAVSGLNPEAEVDPGKLQEVIDFVRRSGATTVFVEPLVSPRVGETIARETGATTAVLDPIESLSEDEAARGDDYFSLMQRNLDALRTALGCS
jgi:zinc transport system substrate-binding protein